MRLEEIIKGVRKTNLLYLSDSYMRSFQAKLLRTQPVGRNSTYIILDRTVFHPKGGGQPSDTGVIYNLNFKVLVKKVMIINGVAIHWGKLLEGEIKGERITGEIEWNARYLYMKRHTGGHLFDHCLTVSTRISVETTDSWLGDPCYVSYKGDCPSTNDLKRAEILENQMISREGSVSIEKVSYQELVKRASNAPNIYRLPSLDSYRIVTIEGCNPIPCAGTHLKNISELDNFTLRKTEKLSIGFRVYYDAQ